MAGRRNRQADSCGWDEWGGYMNAKIQKLQNQYINDAPNLAEKLDASSIFKGIAIFVNGYTVPSADELKRLMATHGGIYHHYYNKQTTSFIIATNLAQAKIKRLTNEKKIVTPNWITDSIAAGRVLPYQEYQLYGTASKNQMTINFQSNGAIENQSTSADLNSEKTSKYSASCNIPPNTAKSNAMCATDSQFLSEFYNHSRLHYISTLAADLKRYVTQLRSEFSGHFLGYEKIEQWKNEHRRQITDISDDAVIMHIDMDCFFVSVGLRKRPDLVGKPVAVTHSRGIGSRTFKNAAVRQVEKEYYRQKRMINSKQTLPPLREGQEEQVDQWNIEPDTEDGFVSTSEVASCSYEARKCGVRNGMFLGEAKTLCPDLKLISYDFDGYGEVAYALYDTIASYTLNIEAVSCDELYVDCSEVLRENQISALEFATILRKEIKDRTGCNSSAGLGCNMLLARLATRKAKPNGQFYVAKRDASDFIKDHLVDDIPGVGWSLSSRLKASAINTCGELQKVSLKSLQSDFGLKTGHMLFKMCRGIDEREIKSEQKRKSVSAEVNYGIRFTHNSESLKFLSELSDEVAKRLKDAGMCGKTVTLKLKVRKKDAPSESSKFMGHGICDSISRSSTLPFATGDSGIINREVQALLQAMKVPVTDLRGIGIQVQRLEPISQTKKCQPNNAMLKYLSTEPTAVNESERIKKNIIVDVTLPSPSQLDQEILAQLPDDIREQIRQEYEQDGKKMTTSSVPKRMSSPRKIKTSPRKRKKLSGSPKKNINRPLAVHFIRQSNDSIVKEKESIERDPPITLCGLSELSDIKTLIFEWISTCSDPEGDDVNTISTYLKNVAVEKNLERVYILLKYLKRTVTQDGSSLWTTAMNEIVSDVQDLVVSVYGAPLKL